LTGPLALKPDQVARLIFNGVSLPLLAVAALALVFFFTGHCDRRSSYLRGVRWPCRRPRSRDQAVDLPESPSEDVPTRGVTRDRTRTVMPQVECRAVDLRVQG
jgi:hypothetical protein